MAILLPYDQQIISECSHQADKAGGTTNSYFLTFIYIPSKILLHYIRVHWLWVHCTISSVHLSVVWRPRTRSWVTLCFPQPHNKIRDTSQKRSADDSDNRKSDELFGKRGRGLSELRFAGSGVHLTVRVWSVTVILQQYHDGSYTIKWFTEGWHWFCSNWQVCVVGRWNKKKTIIIKQSEWVMRRRTVIHASYIRFQICNSLQTLVLNQIGSIRT